jgi:predicted transcriptional regulator of viral defense system
VSDGRAIRTTDEVAALLGRSHTWTETLLQELEDASHIERLEDGRWRITVKTQLRYGKSLRGIEAA